MRPRSVLLASLVAAAGAGAATPPSTVPTDAGLDRVVTRTDVPDATRKVGEVRLGSIPGTVAGEDTTTGERFSRETEGPFITSVVAMGKEPSVSL